MSQRPDQIDVVLTRLRAAAAHAPEDAVYLSETSGVMLLPTRHPTDDLGMSALGHYCYDLETHTKRLNYLRSAPMVVNDETIQWVCHTIHRFKHESAYICYAAEVLLKFCTPSLHEEALLSRRSAQELSSLTLEDVRQRRTAARVAAQHYCTLLKECKMVELISELATNTLTYSDKALSRGVLAGIRALCVDPDNTTCLGAVPGLVDVVYGIMRASKEDEDPMLQIEAVRALGKLACEGTADLLLKSGCVEACLHLLQLRGVPHRAENIDAAAEALEPLCDYVTTAREVLRLNGVALLLRSVSAVRDSIASVGKLYSCVKKLCLNVGGCAEALTKCHAVQILVTSVTSVTKARVLNGPVVVELLGCISVVCATAGSCLSLLFSGQAMLFDLLSRRDTTLEVLVAAAEAVLQCVCDEEARGLLMPDSCDTLVETMMRYEDCAELLMPVLSAVSHLLPVMEVPLLLQDVPMQCMARILRGNRLNAELCTKIAECSNYLSHSRRDVILRDVLPALLEVATSTQSSALRGHVVQLIVSCSKSEQDRATIVRLGGTDLLVDRAVSDTSDDHLTLVSLSLFSLSPDIKRQFAHKGVVSVLVRIHNSLVSSEAAHANALRDLLQSLLRSLIIDEEAEELVMATCLCDVLGGGGGMPNKAVEVLPPLGPVLQPVLSGQREKRGGDADCHGSKFDDSRRSLANSTTVMVGTPLTPSGLGYVGTPTYSIGSSGVPGSSDDSRGTLPPRGSRCRWSAVSTGLASTQVMCDVPDEDATPFSIDVLGLAEDPGLELAEFIAGSDPLLPVPPKGPSSDVVSARRVPSSHRLTSSLQSEKRALPERPRNVHDFGVSQLEGRCLAHVLHTLLPTVGVSLEVLSAQQLSQIRRVALGTPRIEALAGGARATMDIGCLGEALRPAVREIMNHTSRTA